MAIRIMTRILEFFKGILPLRCMVNSDPDHDADAGIFKRNIFTTEVYGQCRTVPEAVPAVLANVRGLRAPPRF